MNPISTNPDASAVLTAAANPSVLDPVSSTGHLHEDPLFISNSENVGVSLVTQCLNGPVNFITWKISMEMALSGKMKLSFIRGKIPKPEEDPYQQERWDRCNAVVMSWILNSVCREIGESLIHSRCCIQAWSELQLLFGTSNDVALFNLRREIAALTQGDMKTAQYYGKLNKLWGDEDSLDEFELCDKGSICKSTQAITEKKQEIESSNF